MTVSTRHCGPNAFGPQWGPWLRYAWHCMSRHINLDEIIKLCPETKSHLYPESSDYAGSLPLYSTGSRPVLEKMLTNLSHALPCLNGGASDVIFEALSDWVYWEVLRRGEVLRLDKWSNQLIEGGVEEDVLGFIGRTITFECARLLATMLQMKQIPARLVLLLGDDYQARAGVEVMLEKQWLFYDLKNNQCYSDPGGRKLSVAEANEKVSELRDLIIGIVEYPVKPDIFRASGKQAMAGNAASKRAVPRKGSAAQLVESADAAVEYDAKEALAARITMSGKRVMSARELTPYTGWGMLHGEAAWINEFSANEPPMSGEVVVCAETADFLYSEFTSLEIDYQPGQRPVLDELMKVCVLRDAPRPGDDQELVFKVFNWVFYQVLQRYLALWDIWHAQRLRYYGDDEGIASFRNRCDCYCASRLSASLLQVAGIPSRLVYMENATDRGGHTCFEAFVRGKWRLWDVSCHDYALNRDGEVASVWEVISDSYCRTEGLREDKVKPTSIIREEYLSNCGIANYPIADTTKNYYLRNGSLWYPEGETQTRKSCRFGF